MALLDQGIPDTPIERRPLSQVATPSDWMPPLALDSVANWYWVERPTQAHHLHIGGVSFWWPRERIKGIRIQIPN